MNELTTTSTRGAPLTIEADRCQIVGVAELIIARKMSEDLRAAFTKEDDRLVQGVRTSVIDVTRRCIAGWPANPIACQNR